MVSITRVAAWTCETAEVWTMYHGQGNKRVTKRLWACVKSRWRHNMEVGSGGQFSPNVWPHNLATWFGPPSATRVSAEPFSHGTVTLRCLQKEMVTYRHWSVSLWRDPDDVSHCRILFPDKTVWRLISATLCEWRRCFVADQLWFMTRIQEEEEGWRIALETLVATSDTSDTATLCWQFL